MWGAGLLKSQSNFFEGDNIFETMVSDTIINAILKLDENIRCHGYCHSWRLSEDSRYLSKIQYQNIIICGDPHSGKTSLVENLTKCKIFPPNIRAPIHLTTHATNGNSKSSVVLADRKCISGRFKCVHSKYPTMDYHKINKEDIYAKVCGIMSVIPHNEITDRYVEIDIYDNNLPDLQICVLPSFMQFDDNPKISDKILNLYKNYLQINKIIVLCAISATLSSLFSSRSLQLIKQMNVESNCIIALTMIDKLNLYNIESNLIKRILKIDKEIVDLNFSSCVAVINKTDIYQHNLKENDAFESNWFNINIINCMPTEYIDRILNIKNNITIKKLLQTTCNLYKNKYVEVSLPVLVNIKSEMTSELNNLQPDSITKEELEKYLLNIFDIDTVTLKFTDMNIDCANNCIGKRNVDSAESKYRYCDCNNHLILLLTNKSDLEVDFSSRINNYWAIRSSIEICTTNIVSENIFFICDYVIENLMNIIRGGNRWNHEWFDSAMDEIKKNINEHNETLKNKYFEEIITTTTQHLNYLHVTKQDINKKKICMQIIDMVHLLITHNLLKYVSTYSWSEPIYYESDHYTDVKKELQDGIKIINSCICELETPE